MKKTMKTFEAINLYTSLSSLIKDTSRKLPGDIAWNIFRVYRVLEPIKNDFDELNNNKFLTMKSENKATEETTENGQVVISVKPEYMPEYVTYVNEIANTEVNIDFYIISQESFDKLLNTCDLSIPEIEAIEKMVNGEE